MKSTIASTIILFSLLISCQNSLQEDHSFTLEEYHRRGIPEPGLNWEIEDYERVYEQLSQIKYQQPLSLPRKDSKKSGVLFRRLLSPENLAFLENDSLPLHDKVFRIRYYGDFMDDLISIYEDPFKREEYYHVELAYIYANKINVGQEMMNLAKIILSSESKHDRAQVADLHSIRQIYLNKLYQVMGKQMHRSLFSKREYRMLCDSVGAHLNRNMQWFDSEMTSKIGEQLQQLSDSVDIPAVRREYLEILAKLEEQ